MYIVFTFSWTTTNLKSQGRLSIDSGGYKNMKFSAGLDESHLDAKGGIVAGNIELKNVNTYCESHHMQSQYNTGEVEFEIDPMIEMMHNNYVLL